MMDFLRGLAPRRDGDTSWAVPVVPSRFSESRPLLLATPPPVHTPGPDADVAQPLPPAMRARTAPPSRPAHDSAVTDAPAPTAPIALQAARPERAQDLDVRPIVLRQPPARVITAPLVEHASAAPISRRETEPPSAARAATPLALPRVTARLAATPAVERTDGAATVSAPLSAAALAERSAQQATAPPVIHVTIDRIEVRAPAASRPAAAPARSRAHAPSVSLTDYLRRSRNPGGAP